MTIAPTKTLDVITIGRSSVDLYGQQLGTRLEDVTSFAKSVGGCPANIAIGTARLGLKSALLSRVGDEQMGRFIREQLVREGVETSTLRTDPSRMTALVLLSVESEHSFPLIFVRTDCADMALDEGDVDEAAIASARAIVVTGTHFSRPNTDAAQRKAIRLARQHGAKVVFDIDYRPNLWGLAGHAAGESRYIKSDRVSAHLRTVLADCDLIVGTEEEVMIAAGADDALSALRTIRSLTPATIVLKRGPMGCVVHDGPILAIDGGVVGTGFPIEVYNVLGAGDAFMSGFLRGWLKGEPLATCATWANACGALVVSRLLCSPESPTFAELRHFLDKGSTERALRRDPALNHVHWATTRRPQPDSLMALAVDHRSQLEVVARRHGKGAEAISTFKSLAVEAAIRVADGRPGFGVLVDGTYGQQALVRAGAAGLWIGRPVEKPGSRPLEFDGMADLGSHLVEWPVNHTLKCLCFWHPDDPAELKARQERELLRVFEAARRVGRELLIEIIAGPHGPLGRDTVASILHHLYRLGIRPDWWKLEPQDDPDAFAAIGAVIADHDPYCRGIVLLGLEASEDRLARSFAAAATCPAVKGFAVGRTIFAEAADRWFAGATDDQAAITDMAGRFAALVARWRAASP